MNNLNWIDYIVVAIFLLSTLAGLMRGFIKELTLLITWVAAFILATLFATPLAQLFANSPKVQSAMASAASNAGPSTHSLSMLTIGVSFLVIFVAVLLLGRILSYIVSSATTVNGLGLINRFLGGLFGLVRGFLLIIILMFLVELTAFAYEPAWTQSQFVNAFQPTVKWMDEKVSPSIQNFKTQMQNTIHQLSNK